MPARPSTVPASTRSSSVYPGRARQRPGHRAHRRRPPARRAGCALPDPSRRRRAGLSSAGGTAGPIPGHVTLAPGRQAADQPRRGAAAGRRHRRLREAGAVQRRGRVSDRPGFPDRGGRHGGRGRRPIRAVAGVVGTWRAGGVGYEQLHARAYHHGSSTDDDASTGRRTRHHAGPIGAVQAALKRAHVRLVVRREVEVAIHAPHPGEQASSGGQCKHRVCRPGTARPSTGNPPRGRIPDSARPPAPPATARQPR
jgi:hypothetical protein